LEDEIYSGVTVYLCAFLAPYTPLLRLLLRLHLSSTHGEGQEIGGHHKVVVELLARHSAS